MAIVWRRTGGEIMVFLNTGQPVVTTATAATATTCKLEKLSGRAQRRSGCAMALRCVVRGGAEVWRHVQRRSTARRWWSGDGDCLAEDWQGDNGVSQHRTTSGDNGDGSDSNDMQAREALRAGAEDR
jgi:hypothetical protein